MANNLDQLIAEAEAISARWSIDRDPVTFREYRMKLEQIRKAKDELESESN